ncbi:COP9 signalosome complex subunit 7a-like protein [Elsinoe fawcettii]|nr:COP9 signalosome complex subunit 7a-like protein [Elsinoe fawcettii]
MEQQKSLSALYPFLALCKSASSPRQAADIVTQATSAPNTFVFAELLSTPAIQSLRADAQHNAHYKLLELFTWGTWHDYLSHSASLPPLSEKQAHKLRLLSLLSLASSTDSVNSLTYPSLTSSLGLSSHAELESLVTDAIYADLLTATLDPANQLVVVSAVAALRDLPPGSVGDMIRELEAWSGRCESVLAEIEARIEGVIADAGKRGRWDAMVEEQRERAEGKWGAVNKEGGDVLGGGGGGGFGQGGGMGGFGVKGDAMDVDTGPVTRGKRSWFGRKK